MAVPCMERTKSGSWLSILLGTRTCEGCFGWMESRSAMKYVQLVSKPCGSRCQKKSSRAILYQSIGESSALPMADSNSTDWYRTRLLPFSASHIHQLSCVSLLRCLSLPFCGDCAAPQLFCSSICRSACIDLMIPVTVNTEINIPSFAPFGVSSPRRRLMCSSRKRGL
jgi:hypothetical protein